MRVRERQFVHATIKLLLVLLVFVLAGWFAVIAEENAMVQALVFQYGYIGIFAISVFSGFNLIIPIPAIAFLPLFLQAGLGLWITLFLITLGMTVADGLAYLIGRFGRRVFQLADHNTMFVRLDKLRARNPVFPLIFLFFYASFAPLPNELVVIPLGFLAYRASRLIPILFAGNALFNILGAFGVITLFNFF